MFANAFLPLTAENVALALTVVALLLAVWQSFEAKRQTGTLSTITGALSTRYLGTFPKYLPEISELIGRVEHELLIVCTYPMQGVFSAPDEYLAIKHQLERLSLSHEKRVIAIFGDAANRRDYLKDQFRLEIKDWQNWRSEATNSAKLKNLIARAGLKISVSDLTSDGFLELFEAYACEGIRTSYAGATVYEFSHRYPLNLWISVGKEAVFALHTTSPTFVNHAFWTSDLQLINAFVQVHREYQRMVR